MQRFKISIHDYLRLIRDLYFFIDPQYIRKSPFGLKGIFSKIFPRLFFLIFGLFQKSSPNQFFDAGEFSSKFPATSLSHRFPVFKYLISSSGQRPQIAFDSSYLSQYPDLRSFRRSSIIHFLRFGKSEGRSVYPIKTESNFHECRFWYTSGRVVQSKKTIEIVIDSCKGVDYCIELSGINENVMRRDIVIETPHNHKLGVTVLSDQVSVDINVNKIIVKLRTHTDLVFEQKHTNLFLASVLNDLGSEDPETLELIATYFKKLGFQSQNYFYVGKNQTFSSRTFNYTNLSRMPVSIRRRNLEMKVIHKILLISHDDSLSGAPLFVLQIYRQMVSQGFQVQILVLKKVSESIAKSVFADSMPAIVYVEEIASKVHVSRDSNSEEGEFADVFSVIFSILKPDIVIGNTVVSAEATVRAAMAGITTVLLVHETWGFTSNGLSGPSPQEVAIRECLQCSNLVVFGSKAARERWKDPSLNPNSLVLASSRWMSPIGRIGTVQKLELRQKLGIPAHAFVYLSIGTFEERKRTIDAIDSFIALSSSSDFLVLVGDWSLIDPYCNSVRKIAEKFGNIKIVDTTPNLEEYYFTADCFILMSANEVYPLVLQEAAAYGLPRIISKFEGYKECVKSIDSALFYETGNLEELTELMRIMRNSSEIRAAVILESETEVVHNKSEASKYVDRLFNRLSIPHVTNIRIAADA